MGLTPSEKQKAYRARLKDAGLTSATADRILGPTASPLEVEIIDRADANYEAARKPKAGNRALIELIEMLYLDGTIKTVARRKLLDALGA